MRKPLQACWEDTRRNLPFTNPIIQGLEMWTIDSTVDRVLWKTKESTAATR